MQIGEFVALQQGLPAGFNWGVFTAVGQVFNQRLVGGLIFNNFTDNNAHIHIGITSPHCFNRELLNAIFEYPFHELGKKRLTGLIKASNIKCRRLAERLGFKLEGVARKYYDDDDDLCFYGILKEEYINGWQRIHTITVEPIPSVVQPNRPCRVE